MTILLIGNSGTKTHDTGGQTTKLRLYKDKIVEEGCDLIFVDLEHFFFKIFFILLKIKKSIKKCDRIVLLSGERACKFLIPFINRHNRKTKKCFVLPLVGSGVLHFSLDHLNEREQMRFMFEKEFSLGKKNNKIRNELAKIDYILPETELMKDIYSEFYNLSNCIILNNFRDIKNRTANKNEIASPLKIIFISRVMREKGIFDLLQTVKIINKNKQLILLDIFGDVFLSKDDSNLFYSLLDSNIVYKGVINNSAVIKTIGSYDLFVFPTRFFSEGTPGVIAESLIAGTPVVTSNFPQAKYLLKDGYDSIFYEIFSQEDLYNKLFYCLNNTQLIYKMKENAYKSGNNYLYYHERSKFLKYVCGIERKQ